MFTCDCDDDYHDDADSDDALWTKKGKKRSEQGGASERVSGVSEQANGRASSPVLTSGFLVILDHSVD